MIIKILHINYIVHNFCTRGDIFAMHTHEMRESGTLSPNVNLKELAANTTRFS